MPKYVLVTAAKNEEKYIGQTIESVINQTIRPEKWVIVSDSSNDLTDNIVRKNEINHPWIVLKRKENTEARNFGAQARAINWGYESIRDIQAEFVGNFDADITIEHTYFEQLIEEFKKNAKLGLAGGYIHEKKNGGFVEDPLNSPDSVAHAVQLFRKKIFDSIGGYLPMPYGGSDTVAEDMVRMSGYEVKSFKQLIVRHHKPILSGEGWQKGAIRQGKMDYSIGTHPLFEMFRCLRRIIYGKSRALVVFRIIGYFMAVVKNEKSSLAPDIIKFIRKRQMRKLFGGK